MDIICGIEIKSSDAIIALVEINNGQGTFVKDTFNRISLNNDGQEQYKSFLDTFNEFIIQNTVSKIYLKKPMDKGQQIAGPNAFRIEALINLAPVQVKEVHSITLASFSKKNTMEILNSEESNKYQAIALWAAMWGMKSDK